MRKLELNKEVIMNLGDSEMDQVRGGVGPTVTTVTITTVFVPTPTGEGTVPQQPRPDELEYTENGMGPCPA